MAKRIPSTIFGGGEQSRDFVYFAILGIIYISVYGMLLIKSNYFPYVMDNNESFSSLWHAINLYHFDFFKSFGLTDEAYGYSAAAHPYVHSHQGNFPRLFAFLIYVFGAQTVESQIVVTTAIIGTATMGLMFAVFRRAAGATFAFTACIVFMTDYVLFGQWQVVTYRVWYGFLLFSSLLCAQKSHDSSDVRWRFIIAMNFACIFYFELIFAAFVTIFTALYVAWLDRRAPLKVCLNWVAMGSGACFALGILFAQVVAYMGWTSALHDVQVTFLARNDFKSATDLIADMAAFYEKHNVLFWHNFQDRTQYASIEAFVRSLTNFDWSVHTPLLSTLVWILMLGWGLGLLPERARLLVHGWIHSECLKPNRVRVTGIAIFGASLFSFVVFATRYDGVPLDNSIRSMFWKALLPAIIAAILLSKFTIRKLGTVFKQQSIAISSIAGARVLLLTSVPVFAASAALAVLPDYYNSQYQPIWAAARSNWGPHFAGYVAVMAALALALRVALQGTDAIFGKNGRMQMLHVFAILAVGFSAYAVVYVLSPGYIYSGYLYRMAPFTVFLTDIVVATAVFTVWRLASAAIQELWNVSAGREIGNALVSAGLAFYIAGYWFNLQWHYVNWLPPTHFAFLKSLGKDPYRGASFVVDTYAAPVAAYTGAWAYFDPGVQRGLVNRSGQNPVLRGNEQYLWLADRATNIDYARPQYYVCMIPQSLSTVVMHLQSRAGVGSPPPGCNMRGLVKLSMEKDSSTAFDIDLVGIDKVGPDYTGFDSWAIVRLGWGGPGGLRRIDWAASNTDK